MRWRDLSILDKIVLILGICFGFLLFPAALYIENTFGWLALAFLGVVFLLGATICVNKKLGNIAAFILLVIGAFLIGSIDIERPSPAPHFFNFFDGGMEWIEN